jgi:Ca-activated chloride channel family protein
MKRLVALGALCALAGCSDAGSSTPATSPGSRGVTQGGAQDIAYFRSIVESGEVPRPDTIEPVGFFAEHALDLPPADCGDAVCMHASLAVAPGIDGASNWTMAFVALNSPVDPRAIARPDTHVVLVIEDTTRTLMGETGGRIDISEAIRAFTSELLARDRLSIVRVGSRVEVLAHGVAPTDAVVGSAPSSFDGADTSAALYDGLARASQLVTDISDFEGASRVVVVTSGVADAGITDSMRIVALGEALARNGVGVSVVGIGESYRPELAMQISEGGGGSYYFAEDIDDLEQILTLEGRTSLFPLATDFELVVEAAAGYRIGRVYGARRAWAEQVAAHLESPVLMVGNRTGSEDIEEGRRGGGGGLFVELIADASLRGEIGPGAPAYTARATWTDASSGLPVSQETVVLNGLAPSENPSGMFPFFSDPVRGKAFMMLNMYLSLRTASELFHEGSCGESLGVVPALEQTYQAWQVEYDNDPDIEADWMLLSALSANVQTRCTAAPIVPNVPMGCFYD